MTAWIIHRPGLPLLVATMPIRRPRTPRPALRHVACLEAMVARPGDDPRQRVAHVLFLVLRLFEHWVTLGTGVTGPASLPLATARELLASPGTDDALRPLLVAFLDALAALPDAEPHPVLPRLLEIGEHLEAREFHGEAGDVFATVARHADAFTHFTLAHESRMRAGRCLLRADDPDAADLAYQQAAQLASRERDRRRAMLARLGRAQVQWARGEYVAADASIVALIAEAEQARATADVALLASERTRLARAAGARDHGPGPA